MHLGTQLMLRGAIDFAWEVFALRLRLFISRHVSGVISVAQHVAVLGAAILHAGGRLHRLHSNVLTVVCMVRPHHLCLGLTRARQTQTEGEG